MELRNLSHAYLRFVSSKKRGREGNVLCAKAELRVTTTKFIAPLKRKVQSAIQETINYPERLSGSVHVHLDLKVSSHENVPSI